MLDVSARSPESLPVTTLQVDTATSPNFRAAFVNRLSLFSGDGSPLDLDGPLGVSLILWWFPFAFCAQNGNKLMYI